MAGKAVEESLDDLTCDQVRALVRQLRRAVSSHELVGQAVGVLLATYRISPDEAWQILRTTSQRTNIKVATIARAVIESAADLPATDPEAHRVVVSDLLPRPESSRARSRQIDGNPTPRAIVTRFQTKIEAVSRA